jgi:glycosyl transferase, family 25
MRPVIFVISLPGSTARQQAIAAQLGRRGLAFSWLEGVNGRSLDEAAVRRLYGAERAECEGGRQLSRGEVGCALSHLKVYQTMLDEALDLVLVLEDDAALSENFAEELAQVCTAIDWNDNELVLLSHIHKYTDWGARRIGPCLRLVRPVTAYNGNGYLITRQGAKKLLAALRPVYLPADCWNHLQKKGVLRIRGIVPYLVNHSRLSENSLIGDVLRVTPTAAANHSLARMARRILYDKFIYQLLVKPVLRIRKQRTSR